MALDRARLSVSLDPCGRTPAKQSNFHPVTTSGPVMTYREYLVIAKLLVQAEAITVQHPPLTADGQQIQAQIRELLTKVVAEQTRAANREKPRAAGLKRPGKAGRVG